MDVIAFGMHLLAQHVALGYALRVVVVTYEEKDDEEDGETYNGVTPSNCSSVKSPNTSRVGHGIGMVVAVVDKDGVGGTAATFGLSGGATAPRVLCGTPLVNCGAPDSSNCFFIMIWL